ncbi:hypothetical protein GCM10027079_33200 [Sediminivirga luteola]|uniref:Uncharacterized protein n=1 Tax=Sediminivirga luteola TaxID=1774748 RepID=A0A8J2TXU5_9MICO|nr:hypothetical protein GCM10011333_16120 [Sediminivirga luteola]
MPSYPEQVRLPVNPRSPWPVRDHKHNDRPWEEHGAGEADGGNDGLGALRTRRCAAHEDTGHALRARRCAAHEDTGHALRARRCAAHEDTGHALRARISA